MGTGRVLKNTVSNIGLKRHKYGTDDLTVSLKSRSVPLYVNDLEVKFSFKSLI